MKHEFIISKNGYVLKPLELHDIDSLRILRNKDQNRICFLYSEIISEEQQRKWYEGYLEKDGDYMFAIFKENRPDDFLGAAAIYNFNNENNSAEFGRIVLDKTKLTGSGIGTLVTNEICNFSFKQFNLNEIVLEVFEDNVAAVKTYEKVGFKKILASVCGDRTLLKMSFINKKL